MDRHFDVQYNKHILFSSLEKRADKNALRNAAYCSCSSYLLEEGRILSQVLGHHVHTEEVTIDPLARHRQAVQVLVLICSLFEQLQTFFFLNTKGNDYWKTPRGNNFAARSTRWGKRKTRRCAADRFIPDHGTNKGTGLHGAGAHGFCAALTEQTCHGGFVCQAELPLVLVKKTRRSALKKPQPPAPQKKSEVLFFLNYKM